MIYAVLFFVEDKIVRSIISVWKTQGGYKLFLAAHITCVSVFRLWMLTSGDDSLQSNDVGMVKLAHDAGFTQKVTSLLLRVSGF